MTQRRCQASVWRLVPGGEPEAVPCGKPAYRVIELDGGGRRVFCGACFEAEAALEKAQLPLFGGER